MSAKPRRRYPKFQLRYMLIESCCECNLTCVSGEAGEEIKYWCQVTNTEVTDNKKGEGSFPKDCPLKVFREEGKA
jgi:hypothetical protein